MRTGPGGRGCPPKRLHAASPGARGVPRSNSQIPQPAVDRAHPALRPPADDVVVGHHCQGEALVMERVEEVEDRRRGHAVEIAGGLVGQQQARPGDQRPGDRHPLTLTARERRRRKGDPVAEANAFQRDSRPVAALPPRHPGIDHGQRHVLQHRSVGQQVERLEHEPDLAAPPGGPFRFTHPGRVGPVEEVGAGRGLVQEAEQVEQRRLPRARRPDDRQVLPRLDDKVDPGDGVDLGWSREGPAHPAQFDDGGRPHRDRPTITRSPWETAPRISA